METDSALEAVHRIYQGDTTYPVSGDDDYDLRLGFAGDAVDAWALRGSEEDIRWNELFVSLADSADGDKDAATDTLTYAAPSDFVELSSKVYITDSNNGNTYYDVIKPDQVMLMQDNDPSGYYCWITGNEDTGYTLHINSPVAGTINYDYYKQPTLPTTGTDILEMKRPYFVVHFILARLFELDGRNDLTTFHEAKAANLINAMLIDNELLPANNSDPIFDYQASNKGVRFGK